MTEVYKELAERIRGEISDLDSIVSKALKAWEYSKKVAVEADFYIDSVALNLHGFYSGLERLFELIARHIDRRMPSRETWHRDLLGYISEDLPGVRSSVISPDTARDLDPFRRFRHLVRNVYAVNLVPDKMEVLVLSLPALWSRLREELLAFANFLEALFKEAETD